VEDTLITAAGPPRAAGPLALPGFVPVPADRADRYRRAGYWTGQTLAELILDRMAQERPDRVALAADGGQVTCGELVSSVDRLADLLHRSGLRRGDRTIVQLPNRPEFVLLVLALWRLGAIPTMALPAYREHELRHIARASGAVALAVPGRPAQLARAQKLRVAEPSLAHLLRIGPLDGADAPRRPEPEDGGADGELALDGLGCAPAGRAQLSAPLPTSSDIAVLLLSGGTTALPKLIPRTHDDYGYNVRVSAEICGVGPETVYLAVLPAGHNFTLGCPGIMGTLLRGGQVAFASATDPDAILDAVDRYGVTMTAMVPTLAERVAEAAARRGRRPASLRLLQVGGARLFPGPARRIAESLGGRLQQVYGMAEGLLNFTRLDDSAEVVLGTQGRPASAGDEVRITSGSGQEVAPGEVGELCCRGPYTIAGYFAGGEQNELAFTPDGFYRTGDLVRQRPSGHLVVEGRVKDVINKAGEKIAAAELEALALGHPGVAQAAVVATPSDTTGEGVCLCVVAAGPVPPTLRDLRLFLAGQGIARYKLPDRLELLAQLPLTPIGKVDKAALRLRMTGAAEADR